MLVNERTLKNMKAVDVNYQLTFNNKFFREKKKLNEVKDILRVAFEKMIEHVKKNLRPGDIMRAAIHNEKLDLPIYVPCRPMEEMNAEAMMECLIDVLNSNEDIPFDSTCRIDIGAIKYPRGGKGLKITNIEADIIFKKSRVQIKNTDNLCLLRAAPVAYCGVCRTSNDEYKRLKRMHPTLTPAEILIQFEKCPNWYWRKVRGNKEHKQDSLTLAVFQSLAISKDQPLTYSLIPTLEYYFNTNIYIVRSALGNAFSYISENCDQEREKNIFISHRQGFGTLSRHC